ncbi:Gfo/Idh/MocA family oxidoreductase [uncultured Tateyamaria sp.]|uniref:Gfo/Idh/MocA family protein n=1 Tax=uncultured Tateyamaria sp. TaxID=455651 RepID=UPI002630A8C9|nr:Gfo/Idh/MocA family oxidoreductase [uncultured Tateyamaria sp.]
MADPVNWGILGAGKFAREHMGPAIHAAAGARLAGLATSSADKAAQFQAVCPDLTVYDDYDALLADPAIEAVYIPLPNHLHVEWSLRALAAGKHVLCEKPMAMAAAEYEALIDARDSSGLFATEAYMIVHHPQWQRARALYQDGAIGTLRHVDGLFAYDNAADPGNVRNRPETGGGGIPDIGVYTYGATRWLTGQEPDAITHADVDFENGVDVVARVSARFPGFSAHWVNAMRMHPCQKMTFVGDAGVMTLTAPFNPGVFATARLEIHKGMRVIEERFPGANHYVLQVEAFSQHLRSGGSYPWQLEDARGTQAVIDAVFARAGGAAAG